MSSERTPRADIAGVRALIDRHYTRELTIAYLAKKSGLSPFHFIRAFRQEVGSTPHQYQRARRIDRAKELLVTTPLPITEICDRIGFQSLGSFSSLFRRLTGETPAGYRAERRKDVYIPACFVRMYRADHKRLSVAARLRIRRAQLSGTVRFQGDGAFIHAAAKGACPLYDVA